MWNSNHVIPKQWCTEWYDKYKYTFPFYCTPPHWNHGTFLKEDNDGIASYHDWSSNPLSGWCHGIQCLSALLALCEGNPQRTRNAEPWCLRLMLDWTGCETNSLITSDLKYPDSYVKSLCSKSLSPVLPPHNMPVMQRSPPWHIIVMYSSTPTCSVAVFNK